MAAGITPITITEIKLSREEQGTPDSQEYRRKFVVEGDDPNIQINIEQILAHPNMVQRGDSLPTNPALKARDYGAVRVDNTQWIYEVTWTYRPADVVQPDDEPDTGDPDFVGVELDASSEWVDGWRVNPGEPGSTYMVNADGTITLPALPTNEDSANDAGTADALQAIDIGGGVIDSNGEPTSVGIKMGRIRVTHYITDIGIFPAYLATLGKRNSAVFFGAAPGKLLYVGPNATREGQQLWKVTHEFAWDEDYHLRQVVWRHVADGKPAVGNSWPGVVNAYGNFGWPVRYVQPYPLTTSFESLQIPPL